MDRRVLDAIDAFHTACKLNGNKVNKWVDEKFGMENHFSSLNKDWICVQIDYYGNWMRISVQDKNWIHVSSSLNGVYRMYDKESINVNEQLEMLDFASQWI